MQTVDVPSGPKTIKLKRPSEMGTVKLGARPELKTPSPPAVDESAKFGKTAALEDTVGAEDASSPTQRKTIRVKRPSQRQAVSVKGVSVARPESGEETSEEEDSSAVPSSPVSVATMAMGEDKCNPLFPIFAIAGALVLIVSIYLFLAQAIGPNSSLTELSYKKTGPDLSWPGKILSAQ